MRTAEQRNKDTLDLYNVVRDTVRTSTSSDTEDKLINLVGLVIVVECV